MDTLKTGLEIADKCLEEIENRFLSECLTQDVEDGDTEEESSDEECTDTRELIINTENKVKALFVAMGHAIEALAKAVNCISALRDHVDKECGCLSQSQ